MRSISPGQKWPGFSFALQRIIHAQAFTAAFLPSMQLYHQNTKSVYRALQGLFR
jgi:hypothetical protein